MVSGTQEHSNQPQMMRDCHSERSEESQPLDASETFRSSQDDSIQNSIRSPDSQSRRELLRGALRAFSLAGISALFMFSRTRSGPIGSECINRGICPKCDVFDKCDLPQALCVKEGSARQPTHAPQQKQNI